MGKKRDDGKHFMSVRICHDLYDRLRAGCRWERTTIQDYIEGLLRKELPKIEEKK